MCAWLNMPWHNDRGREGSPLLSPWHTAPFSCATAPVPPHCSAKCQPLSPGMAQGPLLQSEVTNTVISRPVLLLKFSSWSKDFQIPNPPGSCSWICGFITVGLTFLTSVHAKKLVLPVVAQSRRTAKEKSSLGLAGHGRDQAQGSQEHFSKRLLLGGTARHKRGWKTRNRHLQRPPERSQRGAGLQPTHRARGHSTRPPIARGFL